MSQESRDRLLGQLSAALADDPGIRFAVVYGSFLDLEAFRDVDLGIWTTDAADKRLDVKLAASLSSALGVPFDVRRLNDAPVPFLYRALRGRIVLVRDEELLANLMERIAREYHDLAPRLRRATIEAFAK